MKYSERGITLIALVVTIVVLIILASVSIGMLTGESGIVKKATEAQIMTELANVKEALDKYKASDFINGVKTDEDLVEEGLLKEVFIKDTYRTIGVITNLKTININGKLGKTGSKQEEIEENTLLDLYDIYGVDMTDGTLYYIKDGIWSIDGNKTIYIANTGEEKQGYEIETVNKEYVENAKFITEWTVDAGMTITLPINEVPNITIEWGADDDSDGKLDIEECTTIKPTHTYTNAGTYIVKIAGNMPNWSFWSVGTSKDYITGLKQWGKVGATYISFNNCVNLAGTIPEHKIKGEFIGLTSVERLFYGCSKLKGEIPETLFENTNNLRTITHTFSGCTGLTGSIPEKLFADCVNLTVFDCVFYNCENLIGTIPEKLFENNKKAVRMYGIFYGCTGLTGEIPERLFWNNKGANTFENIFNGCAGITGGIPEKLFYYCPNITVVNGAFCKTSITEIPVNLFNNKNGQTNSIKNLEGVFSATKIKTVPAGLFDLCTEATHFGVAWTNNGGVFEGCSELETIPEGLFYKCTKVNNFSEAFQGCSKLKEIPDNLFNTSESVEMYRTFTNCRSLSQIPGTIFENVPNIRNYQYMFDGCSNLTEIGDGFKISEIAENLVGMFEWCQKLNKIPQNFVIPENVKYMERMFRHCNELKATIVLKATQPAYEYAFDDINSEFRVNWAAPCTEEKIDEILAATGGSGIKGVEVTE